MQSGLGTKVLRDVSRSFYLSLRFLPEGFRAPASVGYLLARLSDTIADAGGASIEERRDLLAKFKSALLSGERSWIRGLTHLTGLSEGEQVLVRRTADCLDAIDDLPAWQQDAVKKVVEVITEGQTWDLSFFDRKGLVQVSEDEELLTYTYRVAGCVGEFWTELGFGLGDFARESREQMDEWARSYGRSLQLINILRDVSEDWEIGRCYLPGGITDDERMRWISVARQGLLDAECYCRALNGKRMRFATWLPLLIGRETLDLLEHSDVSERVKVTRSDVKRIMRKATLLSLWG